MIETFAGPPSNIACCHGLCEYAFMRTTLDIPDALFKQAKHKAISEGVSLKTVVERALQKEVAGSTLSLAARKKRAQALFAALDKARNKTPVGSLRRETLYDR
jgi:hypothetical protein